MKNLKGYSYAVRTAVGTTQVVSAASNLNGVIIARARVSAIVNGSQVTISTDGKLLCTTPVSGAVSVNRQDVIEGYFIPAGQTLDMTISGSAEEAFIWYKVL